MNKLVNNFLLAWDKFKPEMNLRQPALYTVLVDHLKKNKKKSTKIKKQGDSCHIY